MVATTMITKDTEVLSSNCGLRQCIVAAADPGEVFVLDETGQLATARISQRLLLRLV